jgi:hypothetical protein
VRCSKQPELQWAGILLDDHDDHVVGALTSIAHPPPNVKIPETDKDLSRIPDSLLRHHHHLRQAREAVTPGEDPEGRYYEFAGQGALDKLLAGIIRPSSVVTPAGFEPAISTLKGSCPGPG